MEWRPPKTKTSFVQALREHTAAMTQFGFRPSEIRLNRYCHGLYTGGSTRPTIPNHRGVPVPVNIEWQFVKSVPWDLIEYLAAPPADANGELSDRRRRIVTFLTPGAFDWDEALLYFGIREALWRRCTPEESAAAIESLAPLLGEQAPKSVAELVTQFSTKGVSLEESVALALASV